MDKLVHQSQITIVDTIDYIVTERLKEMETTMSSIGVVLNDPTNYQCVVRIKGQDVNCSVPEHLHSWIQKDDVVIVQDLYNNGFSKIIVGKTGQLEKNPSIVIYDPEVEKNISGVDGVFEGDEKITYAHVYSKKGF